MSLPLPKRITDLVGRKVYYQAAPDVDPVLATVVGARFTGEELRGRAAFVFILDTGDGPLVTSEPYPEPRDL